MSLIHKVLLVSWPGICGVVAAMCFFVAPWQALYLKCILFTYVVMAPMILTAFWQDYKKGPKA